MSAGGTFERVYRALKEQLGSGSFPPGETLEPRALSDALSSSITPVRDALHRLIGEQLVDAPRGSGFRTPIVTEVALRNLYAWNQTLLLAGLAGPLAATTRPPDRPEDGSPARLRQLELLFARIAARPGNPEHVEAVSRLSARLRPIRVAEENVLDLVEEELARLERQLADGDIQALKRSIRAYHRRRSRAAAPLVAELLAR